MNVCSSVRPHSGFHFPAAVFRTAVKLTPGTGIKITRHVCAKAIKPKKNKQPLPTPLIILRTADLHRRRRSLALPYLKHRVDLKWRESDYYKFH